MLMWRQLIKQKKKLYSVFNFVRNGLWTRGLKAKVGERTLISGIKVRESGGGNNKLYVGNDVKIQNCKITITGDNNRIYIGDNCSLRGTDFYNYNKCSNHKCYRRYENFNWERLHDIFRYLYVHGRWTYCL